LLFNRILNFSAVPGKFKRKFKLPSLFILIVFHLGIGERIGSDQQNGTVTQSTQRQVPLNGQAQGKQQEFAGPTLRKPSSQVSAHTKTNNRHCGLFRRVIFLFLFTPQWKWTSPSQTGNSWWRG
jgi:hypothetical protein